MNRLTDISVIRELMRRHGNRLKKSLGQNFLIDPAVPEEIARSAGLDANTGVIEIGPGIGVLTRELSPLAGKVVAVELDRGLQPILKETLGDLPNVKVLYEDILKTDLGKIAQEELPGMELAVCANLPYYITTPVILYLLESQVKFRSITVMVQKEVAQRICASPGGKEYGALTLAIGYRCAPRILLDVPARSFLPAPKVDSCVVRLDMLEKPPVSVKSEDWLFKIIRASFSQRRKTLANGLHNAYPDRFPKEAIENALFSMGLNINIRGEALSLEKFAEFCEILVSEH